MAPMKGNWEPLTEAQWRKLIQGGARLNPRQQMRGADTILALAGLVLLWLKGAGRGRGA